LSHLVSTELSETTVDAPAMVTHLTRRTVWASLRSLESPANFPGRLTQPAWFSSLHV
jgi:hypothetical protein